VVSCVLALIMFGQGVRGQTQGLGFVEPVWVPIYNLKGSTHSMVHFLLLVTGLG
jgi:hypothetical protein